MHPITKLKVDFPRERGERFVHLEKQSIHYDNFDQYWFWLDQYWLRALSNLACYCSRNENMLLQTPSSWELFDPIKRKPNNCFGSLASCELLRIKTQALERDRFIFLFCDGGGDDDDGGDGGDGGDDDGDDGDDGDDVGYEKSNKRWCAFKPDPPIHLLLTACKQRFPMMTILWQWW